MYSDADNISSQALGGTGYQHKSGMRLELKTALGSLVGALVIVTLETIKNSFCSNQPLRGSWDDHLTQVGFLPSCPAYLTSGSAVAACSGRRPFLSGMLCLAPFLSKLTQPSSQP